MSTSFKEILSDLDEALSMAKPSHLRAQLAYFFACHETDELHHRGLTDPVEHDTFQRMCQKVMQGDKSKNNNYRQ